MWGHAHCEVTFDPSPPPFTFHLYRKQNYNSYFVDLRYKFKGNSHKKAAPWWVLNVHVLLDMTCGQCKTPCPTRQSPSLKHGRNCGYLRLNPSSSPYCRYK